MRIPKEKVDEIYRATDIVEVIGDYIQLKKRGQNYWGLSPFKTERTPSFSVSPAKQIFKDFSSGKGGGAVTFLMEVEGQTYVEALLHLAKKYGIEVAMEEGEGVDKDQRASLQALNNFALKYFQEQLMESDEGKTIGLSYFRERGFNPETIKTFQLGYSPETWDALSKAATRQQYKEDFLLETGLSLRSEKNNELYDRFRGRVIFPILDITGRPVGFAGRILRKDAKAAKYVNSPESILYNKSHILYGLFTAKQAIREADQAILVEGYTDLISLYQAGVHNVVASSGTSLTDGQIKLISRYTKNVLVVYDGDTAGVNATLRALELVLGAGLNAKALHLPDGHDPDSFIKTGGGASFKEYVAANSLDVIRYLTTHTQKTASESEPEYRGRLAHQVTRLVAHLPDPINRQAHVRYAAEVLGMDEQLVLGSVNQAYNQILKERTPLANRQGTTTQLEQREPADGQPQQLLQEEQLDLVAYPETHHQEREILRVMLAYYDHTLQLPVFDTNGEVSETETTPNRMMSYLYEQIGEVDFGSPLLDRLRVRVFSAYLEEEPLPMDELLTQHGPEVAQLTAELLSFRHELSENWEKRGVYIPGQDADLVAAVDSAIQYLKAKRIKLLVKESLDDIRQAQEPTELDRLLRRHKKLEAIYRDVYGKLGTVVPG